MSEGQTISVQNRPLEVRVQGRGPAIVLLHGIQGTADSWAPVAGALKERFRVITPNLRGRGDSYSPEDVGAYDLATFADDLYAVIRWAGEPVLLCGWSMGVLVSLKFVQMFGTGRLQGLVLISGTAAPRGEARWFAAATVPGLVDEAADRARRLGLTRCALPQAVAGSWRCVREQDFRGLLPEVGLPALVVHGTEDDQCPLSHGEELASRIPGAQGIWLPGLGHNLMREAPGQIADAIAEFGCRRCGLKAELHRIAYQDEP